MTEPIVTDVTKIGDKPSGYSKNDNGEDEGDQMDSPEPYERPWL